MIEDLFDELRKLDLSMRGRGSRAVGTARISKCIENFCTRRQIRWETEVYIDVHRQRYGKQGKVDYVLIVARQMYCIEIDASNKRWSLEKLIAAKSLGYVPVWIRWHSVNKLAVPDDVFLISLSESKE